MVFIHDRKANTWYCDLHGRNMNAMASQITDNSTAYSTASSGWKASNTGILWIESTGGFSTQMAYYCRNRVHDITYGYQICFKIWHNKKSASQCKANIDQSEVTLFQYQLNMIRKWYLHDKRRGQNG